MPTCTGMGEVELAPKNGSSLPYFINAVSHMLSLDDISYFSRLPSLSLRFLVCQLSVILVKGGKSGKEPLLDQKFGGYLEDRRRNNLSMEKKSKHGLAIPNCA